MEGASIEATLRQFCEEALDRVEPQARGRCEVEGEVLMAAPADTSALMPVRVVLIAMPLNVPADNGAARCERHTVWSAIRF